MFVVLSLLSASARINGWGDKPNSATTVKVVSEALAELECLGEVPRGHPHLVTVAAQALDQRAHHEHVRAVGQVDPDTHWQAP